MKAKSEHTPDRSSLSLVLYRRQIAEILSSGANTVLLGGRGMGKSSVLRCIAAQTPNSVFIDGRMIDGATAALDDAIGRAVSHGLSDALVDDLDYLLSEDRNPREDLEAVVNKLERLRACLADSQQRLVVTSTSPVSRFLRSFASTLWSDIEARFQPVVLFPWSVGWEATLASYTHQHYPDGGDECAEAVVSSTGGHPALVAAAFSSLREAAASTSGIPTSIRDCAAYLALALGRTALSPIEKALSDLQKSPQPSEQLAAEHLRILVENQGEGPAPKHPQVLRALELAGLAYGDPATGRCRVPGTLIQNYLEGELSAPAARADVSIRVVNQGPDEGLLVIEGSPEKEIPLGKGLWRLISRLVEADGEVVSQADLVEALGLDSSKPLHSIIQRLDQRAREAGIDRLLENVRGQGYRLGRSIRWRR
jgi:hypothetical protein